MSYVIDQHGTRRCEVCGYEPEDGHNPEVHLAEMRAAEYAYYEPPEYDDDLRDYDPPEDEAICDRCGDVGVTRYDERWKGDAQTGEWVVVCRDCTTDAERLDDLIRMLMAEHEFGFHRYESDPTCLYCQ